MGVGGKAGITENLLQAATERAPALTPWRDRPSSRADDELLDTARAPRLWGNAPTPPTCN